MTTYDPNTLLNPKSIAIIGASVTPKKWGNIIFMNILKAYYGGNIYPINPKVEFIKGYKCYPRLKDASEEVNLALIITPAKMVSILIYEYSQKKIQNVVVTANFSKTGPGGAKLEQKIVEKVKKHDIQLVGPNTMGICNTQTALHTLNPPQKGSDYKRRSYRGSWKCRCFSRRHVGVCDQHYRKKSFESLNLW